eukprot:CAMPEP_0173407814 /NCGR_PEP_ID=MMETSP1356-20130122/68157_1 /TAXON_ID=77927 ORGANISM="Hemiselmis virescens, Strain PCC157" /NCGR_SAMPLE_ID=MMETSP1356 /ASSEMBLY_ACC=CAM_ASM_000847 /LENGTH=98 /DNA_ID=CAMNT_0014369039 /DNA_START=54 /DNA_END=350 /DNA_ORIENTATION=-
MILILSRSDARARWFPKSIADESGWASRTGSDDFATMSSTDEARVRICTEVLARLAANAGTSTPADPSRLLPYAAATRSSPCSAAAATLALLSPSRPT